MTGRWAAVTAVAVATLIAGAVTGLWPLYCAALLIQLAAAAFYATETR